MSFARKEGAPLAQRLQKNLAKSGYDTQLDTQRTRSDAVWSTEIEWEIDTRRLTIALLSPVSNERWQWRRTIRRREA